MGRCTVISKEVKLKHRLITDNHYVYIHRIVWDLSFSVVIVPYFGWLSIIVD